MSKQITAERIRELRKQYELTQEELGKCVHASRSSVKAWEEGRTYPSLDSCILLSRLFHVSTDYLIAGSREMRISLDGYSEKERKQIRNLLHAMGEPKER